MIAARTALSLLALCAVTYLSTTIVEINASTAGFLYLVLVLAVATTAGLTEAVVLSVAAMFFYNFFFLPPVGRLTVADPENWVALLAFLSTALVASHLSNSARKQTIEVRDRQKETEQLYELSRSILLTDPSHPLTSQIAQHIADIFNASAAVVYDARSGTMFQGGSEELNGIEPALKQVVSQASAQHDAGVSVWPITLGGPPIGSLALKRVHASSGAIQALLNLVAIGLERVRTEETVHRAEAARHSEEFKSILLDSIAHDFKTPLTSIKAAATSLTVDGSNLRPEQQEFAAIIDEETDRLSQLVSEAVKLSQIDAGKVRIERADCDLANLLATTLSHFEGRDDERIQLAETFRQTPRIFADPELVILTLRQLIDNGLKYSPPASRIFIRSEWDAKRVVVRLIDQGPGIPEREREKIFDKFYRQQDVRGKVPGSGLGLHIAREIARSNGGDLWVEPGNPIGSEFCLALPRCREGQ